MRLNPDARLPMQNDVGALKVRLHDVLREIAVNANYKYDGLTRITVGTAQPTNPAIGDLWVDTN